MMYLPDIQLHRADSLEQAVALMVRYGPNARILAGGTDVLVDLKTGRVGAGHLISISRIGDLKGVTSTVGGVRIGGLTTITELAASPIIRRDFPPILDAACQMAAPQVRNVATVGGNICSAVPCADLPPVFMVLDASVKLWSTGGERTIPLRSFFVGPRQTVLDPLEVLCAVDVPTIAPGSGAAYARLALRDGNAIAVAGVAAGLRLTPDGTISQGLVVLGAVAPVPKLVESAGEILGGAQADESTFRSAADAAMSAAEPISDVRGTAEYRRRMVRILAMRALARARARAEESLE